VRHGDKVKKLGRTASHRRALMRNLVSALFLRERIRTTVSKAKVARQLAERMLSFAVSNTVAARREVARVVADRSLVKKLFDDIGPRLAGYAGGRTRILRLGTRPGDSAEMALLELVVRKEPEKEKAARDKAAKAKGKPARSDKKAAAKSGG
jgi:large subunit ribosomal protein L17